MPVSSLPAFTSMYSEASAFRPDPEWSYIYSESVEDRSRHLQVWRGSMAGVELANIEEIDELNIRVEDLTTSSQLDLSLRSRKSLEDWWKSFKHDRAYLDITGMAHHIWAPVLRAAIEVMKEVRVVYVEPGHYAFSATPTEGQIFDLSERILGIRPLPGFASLHEFDADQFVLVPLLGFEGTRLSYVLEQVQPRNGDIVPIVGLPGFKAEYPFFSYTGNHRPLQETGAWSRVHYAAANCPFAIVEVLCRLAAEAPRLVMKIAPIGTKPHALGAVLFKLVSRHRVELVYDHPVRKAGRTEATDRLLVYNVSDFLTCHRYGA